MQLVIGSTPGSPWLDECLKSIHDNNTGPEFPVMVLQDTTWETGKIRWVFNNTNLESFVFMHDSCVFHKPYELMRLFYCTSGSVALSACPVKFGMFMGKYTRQTLDNVSIHNRFFTKDKEDTIVHEREFADAYCFIEPYIPVLFHEFHDRNGYIEHKNGRDNLVLENAYLKKYKGTWR